MRRGWVVALLASVLTGSVHAYIDYVPLMSVGAWNNNSNVYLREWHRYVGRVDAKQAVPPRGAARATTIAVDTTGTQVARRMAAAYPPAQRAEVERAFLELRAGYRRIEQQFGIPRNDVAGAAAAFIAGSWMAYRGSDFPDANFKPLVLQLQAIIGNSDAFAGALPQAKQEMFDQLVITGMFMATVLMALKRQPNDEIAAHMREVARSNLESFLQTDADAVRLSARGLTLR